MLTTDHSSNYCTKLYKSILLNLPSLCLRSTCVFTPIMVDWNSPEEIARDAGMFLFSLLIVAYPHSRGPVAFNRLIHCLLGLYMCVYSPIYMWNLLTLSKLGMGGVTGF